MSIVTISNGGVLSVESGVMNMENEDTLPSIVIQWDFSDVSTLFQDVALTTPVTANGQTIGGITDKSGNGKTLTQSNAGLRPFYKTGAQNSLSAANTITGRYLDITAGALGIIPRPFTIVVVSKTSATALGSFTRATFASSGGGGALELGTAPGGGFNGKILYGAGGGGTVDSVLQPVLVPNTWFIWVGVSTIGGGTNWYEDGAFDVNNPISNDLTNGARIGHDANLGGGAWDSDIGEVTIYNAAVDAAQRTSIVDSAKIKWGI